MAVFVGFDRMVITLLIEENMTDKTDVKILPIQIIPSSLYKIGTDEGFRLRFGADIESQDLLVIAIKAAIKDPKRIAEAVENFLSELSDE
jgi:hypothetical protein